MRKTFLFSLLVLCGYAQAQDCASIIRDGKENSIGEIKAALRCLAKENASLKELVASASPKGGVMPFKAVSCPPGWTAYARAVGRSVFGVDKNGGRDFALEQTGGQYQVGLTIGNLPAHQHDTMVAINSGTSVFGEAGVKQSIFGTTIAPQVTALTSIVGSSAPFAIIPPYVALLYCEKQ